MDQTLTTPPSLKMLYFQKQKNVKKIPILPYLVETGMSHFHKKWTLMAI